MGKTTDEAKEEKVLDNVQKTAPGVTQAPQAGNKPDKAEKPKADEKPATRPKVDEAQATRDAHYFENGVKANGTGGTAPETE